MDVIFCLRGAERILTTLSTLAANQSGQKFGPYPPSPPSIIQAISLHQPTHTIYNLLLSSIHFPSGFLNLFLENPIKHGSQSRHQDSDPRPASQSDPFIDYQTPS